MIDLRSTIGDHAGFEYVEMASNGTDGMSKWINLFFNGEIIALVDNDSLADQIKQLVPKMTLSENIVSPVDNKATTPTELQELGMSCPKCEGHIEHLRSLDAENKRLRDIKLVRFNNEDCWLRQGDGFDYPESLTCPVVMSADTLRKLINRRTHDISNQND